VTVSRLALTLVAGCFCALQVGCVPAILQRTPHVVGHVTDARTHRPVPQAQVKFRYLEKPTALTDVAGRFDLPQTHEFTLVWFLPLDRFDTFTIDVTKPGYFPGQAAVPLKPIKAVEIELNAKR
jgi:hypothetical protein